MSDTTTATTTMISPTPSHEKPHHKAHGEEDHTPTLSHTQSRTGTNGIDSEKPVPMAPRGGGGDDTVPQGGGGPPGGAGAGAGAGRPKKFSHGFFDPEIAGPRKAVFKIMGMYTILIILVMWSTLPLFWGSFARTTEYTSHLRVAIIDLDTPTSTPLLSGITGTPTLGQWIVAAGLNNSQRITTNGSPVGVLGFYEYDLSTPTSSGIDLSLNSITSSQAYEAISGAVANEDYWAAILINPRTTSNLYTARQNGNTSWVPGDAVTFIYSQARNENVANLIVSITGGVLGRAMAQWGAESIGEFLRSNAGNSTAIQNLYAAPQTVSPGVGYTAYNIRPFQSVATAALLVGQIFLVVYALLVAMSFSAARDIISPFLTTRTYIVMRILVPLTVYFVLTLFLSMVNLPFKMPFGAHFSHGAGFVVFWMGCFGVMSACGFALEFAVTILTPKFVAFFLAFLIVVQVSVVSLPHENQAGIYQYGHAVPMKALSNAFRTICFDTKSSLGKDFGIIYAWAIFSALITMPLITLFYHTKAKKAHEKAQSDAQGKSG